MKTTRCMILPCVLLLALSASPAGDGPSADEMFEQARTLAFDGQRAEARELCARILERSPDYHDVQVLLARLYAWDKEYSIARGLLQEVLDQRGDLLDARRALIDVELWSDHPRAALRLADEGLTWHPDDPDLLARRARALERLDRQDDALVAARRAWEVDPERKETKRLYRRFLERSQRNKFSADYEFETFDEGTDPWHAASFAYRRRSDFGSLFGRVNLARRFGDNGVQFEVDAYPRILDKTYAYLNLGFSSGELFPDVRYGGEVFHNFRKGWEASLGFRRLDFDSSDVAIYTGSVARYHRGFWIALRPQYSSKTSGRSFSARLYVRKFINGRYEYVEVSAGGGQGVDQDIVAEEDDLNDSSIRAEYRRRLGHSLILKSGVGLRSEDVTATRDRQSVFFRIGFDKLF